MHDLLMPYDVYERHKVVSVLLRDRPVDRVLDVGGNLGVLKRFMPARVFTLNVDASADVRYDGRLIPCATAYFDAVVSLDTLEHIPPAMRLAFLRECLRVTRRDLIVAAPFGSSAHRAYEKRLDALYTATTGTPHPYLNEHVRYGIPDADDIARLAGELGLSGCPVYFAGDFAWQCRNFERSLTSRHKRWSRLVNDLSSKAVFHRIRLTQKPYNRANRFYLFVDKHSTPGRPD